MEKRYDSERCGAGKQVLCVVATLILTGTIIVPFGVQAETMGDSGSYPWMNAGEWILFRTNSTRTQPYSDSFSFPINITIDSVTEDVMNTTEVYLNDSGLFAFSGTYDIQTRVSLELPNYSAWFWVNQEDIQLGHARFGQFDAILSQVTNEYYVFEYSDSYGNSSTLRFSRSDFRLGTTSDHVVSSAATVDSATNRIATGVLGGGKSSPGKRSGSLTKNGRPAPLSYGHLYSPPYYNNAGTFSSTHPEWGFGNCQRVATMSANVQTGMTNHYLKVLCERDWAARGWSEGLGRLRGPQQGSFTVPDTGYYYVDYGFKQVTGLALTMASALPTWLGAVRATGYVAFRAKLYQLSTGYLVGCYNGLSDCRDYVVYSFDCPRSCTLGQWWSDAVYYPRISGSVPNQVYLLAGVSYYFEADVYGSHQAAFAGIWGSYWATSASKPRTDNGVGFNVDLEFVSVNTL